MNIEPTLDSLYVPSVKDKSTSVLLEKLKNEIEISFRTIITMLDCQLYGELFPIKEDELNTIVKIIIHTLTDYRLNETDIRLIILLSLVKETGSEGIPYWKWVSVNNTEIIKILYYSEVTTS